MRWICSSIYCLNEDFIEGEELMAEFFSLGIVGTAKNTGKTTVTSCLMREIHQRGYTVGLTSIGYDGESVDNITGLPKPRINAAEGMMIATARRCLPVSKAKIIVEEETDIDTALGRVIIGRVQRQGQVVMAGPNSGEKLRRTITTLKDYGAGVVLVDGALNRLVPMIETDGIMLATGAALEKDIFLLAEHTKRFESLFTSLKTIRRERLPGYDRVMIKNKECQWEVISENNSLLVPQHLSEKKELFCEAVELWIPGIVSQDCMERLINLLSSGSIICFTDPLKLLISGELERTCQLMKRFMKKDISVCTLRSLPLLLVTVNPFFPRSRRYTGKFEADYVEADMLLQVMKKQLDTAVFDIVKEKDSFLHYSMGMIFSDHDSWYA